MSEFCSLLTNYCTHSEQLALSLLLTVADFELPTTVQYFFIKLIGRAQTLLGFRVWPHDPIEESCTYRNAFSVKISTRNRLLLDSIGFAIDRLCDIHCPLSRPNYFIDVYFFSLLAAIFRGRILFGQWEQLPWYMDDGAWQLTTVIKETL
jgi:hypothetical protein